MKFGRLLNEHASPEWKRAYIDYRRLKKLIKAAAASEEDSPVISEDSAPEEVQEKRSDHSEGTHLPTPGPSRHSSEDRPGGSALQRHDSGQALSETSSIQPSGPAFPHVKRRRPASSRTNWRFRPDIPLSELLPKLTPAERKFFDVLDAELSKVNSFYIEREDEARARTMLIRQQLEDLEKHHSQSQHNKTAPLHRVFSKVPTPLKSDFQLRPSNYLSAKRSLKMALLELYKLLAILQRYRTLNQTGFSKALKKYEKATSIPCSDQFLCNVDAASFTTSSTVAELNSLVEDLYAQYFTAGSRKLALTKLRSQGRDETFYRSAGTAGLFLGLAVFPLCDGLYKSFQPSVRLSIAEWPALLQLYGAFLLPVLFACLVTVNLVAWTRSRINYALIMGIPQRHIKNFHPFLELPSLLLLLLTLAFWLSMSDFWPGHIDAHTWPLVFFVTALVLCLNPLPIFSPYARWWLVKRFARVFSAGILRVEFTDFFFGDLLVSQTYFLYNLGFLICSYNRSFQNVPPRCSTNATWVSPVLASLPSAIRASQSIRRYIDSDGFYIHLLNLGKYSITIIFYFIYWNWRINGSKRDATFGAMLFLAALNSCYSLTWDLLFDWNLLKRHVKYSGLRANLGYGDRVYGYYIAIALNAILRFSWFLYIFNAPSLSVPLRGWIVGMLEIIRRWIWNFYRLESEHIGNVDAFRVTRDVPLPFTQHRNPNEEEEEEEQEAVEETRSKHPSRLVATLWSHKRAGQSKEKQ